MTDTTLVFMTGSLLSFPVLYWLLDKLMRKEGRATVDASNQRAATSEGSAFQSLLVRESLDRVLRLVDDLQSDLASRMAQPGAASHYGNRVQDGSVTTLIEARRRSLAECTDLVNALLSEEDATLIRTALSRLSRTTTRQEFLNSLKTARETVADLRQDLLRSSQGDVNVEPG